MAGISLFTKARVWEVMPMLGRQQKTFWGDIHSQYHLG